MLFLLLLLTLFIFVIGSVHRKRTVLQLPPSLIKVLNYGKNQMTENVQFLFVVHYRVYK